MRDSAPFGAGARPSRPASAPIDERVATLTRKLAEASREQDADAAMIGRLLGEVAERDRKLARDGIELRELRARVTDLETRIAGLNRELDGAIDAYSEVVVDLEASHDRWRAAQDESERLRTQLVRSQAPKAKLSTASMKRVLDRSRAEYAETELAWLAESVEVVAEQARAATQGTVRRLEDTRDAIDALMMRDHPREAADLKRSVIAMLRHTTDVEQESTIPAGLAPEELAKRLRRLRDAMGPLLGAERAQPPRRAPRRG